MIIQVKKVDDNHILLADPKNSFVTFTLTKAQAISLAKAIVAAFKKKGK